MIHSVLARNEYTITITVLTTPCPPAVLVWRLLEGDWDRPPAAALGRYMVHRGGGGQWSLPSYGTQYSVLRESAYISTFTLKNLFL